VASNNREAIIELGGRISSLRAEQQRIKQELRTAENELDRLLNHDVPISAPAPNSLAAQRFSERDAERSLNQYIIDALSAMHPEDVDAEELLAHLPEGANITSVRSALARLADQKRIQRTSRGRYGSLDDALTQLAAS
jgi:hypothetical protein